MSARVEVQAPSAQKPWAAPWVAALLALLLAAGTLAWLLTRSSDRATPTHRQPAVSSVTHEDSRGSGLVGTGGATRPIPYQPVGGVDPGAPAAPATGLTQGGWYFHMVSTGGEIHPAPSS